MKNLLVAVDLGSSNLAIVAGSRGDDGKLTIAEKVVIPCEGVTRGEIRNIEQASKSIQQGITQLEEKLGVKVQEVFTGISGEHIRCMGKSYYVLVGGDDEIKKSHVQQLSDSMHNVKADDGEFIVHFMPQKYIINDSEQVSNPVGMFGQKLEATFNFLISNRNAASRLENALRRVNNTRQGKLYINALAAADAVTTPDERNMGVAVVDFGGGTTDICIYHEDLMRHIAVVPIGSNAVNNDLRAYGILEKYIEELKVKYACADAEQAPEDKFIKVPGIGNSQKDVSFKNLALIAEARLTEIFRFVAREIEKSGYAGKLSAGIVLTGGGSLMKGIESLAQKTTGMAVRLGSATLPVDADSASLVADPALAAAVGILLKAIDEGRNPGVENIRRITPPTGTGTPTPPPPTPKPEPDTIRRITPRNPQPDITGNTPDTDVDIDQPIDPGKEEPKKPRWWERLTTTVKETFNDSYKVVDDDPEIK